MTDREMGITTVQFERVPIESKTMRWPSPSMYTFIEVLEKKKMICFENISSIFKNSELFDEDKETH